MWISLQHKFQRLDRNAWLKEQIAGFSAKSIEVEAQSAVRFRNKG